MKHDGLCPLPLMLARQRGDSRLFVDGGVYDQPAGEWFAANYATNIEAMVERIADPELKQSSLSKGEYELYEAVLDIINGR